MSYYKISVKEKHSGKAQAFSYIASDELINGAINRVGSVLAADSIDFEIESTTKSKWEGVFPAEEGDYTDSSTLDFWAIKFATVIEGKSKKVTQVFEAPDDVEARRRFVEMNDGRDIDAILSITGLNVSGYFDDALSINYNNTENHDN